MKNEKYFGIFRHNNEVFNNIYHAIVSADIYNQVRDKVNLNKFGKRSVKEVYLLRYKLKCGYCGQPISADGGTSKMGKAKRYYKCLGRKHHNGCTKSVLRKEKLEDLIIKKILEILQTPKYMNTIVDNLMSIQNIQEDSTVLTALLKEQQQAQTTLDNIMKALEKGITNNTTNR